VNLVRSGTKQPQRIPFSAEDKARLSALWGGGEQARSMKTQEGVAPVLNFSAGVGKVFDN
jgi:hypothetical protein